MMGFRHRLQGLLEQLNQRAMPRAYEQAVIEACERSLPPEEAALFREHVANLKTLRRHHEGRVVETLVDRTVATRPFPLTGEIYTCSLTSKASRRVNAHVHVSDEGYLSAIEFRRSPRKLLDDDVTVLEHRKAG